MAKTQETLESWADEFVRKLRLKTPEELGRHRLAFERAWQNRKNLDIRPLTTTEMIRSIREEN